MHLWWKYVSYTILVNVFWLFFQVAHWLLGLAILQVQLFDIIILQLKYKLKRYGPTTMTH
jgi:hypothetical protein